MSEMYGDPKGWMKRTRVQLGLTQRQLASLLGAGRSTVERWEQDPDNSPSMPQSSTYPPKMALMLLEAFQGGYRPTDWPEKPQRGPRLDPKRLKTTGD